MAKNVRFGEYLQAVTVDTDVPPEISHRTV
jgi:hypothetical protein